MMGNTLGVIILLLYSITGHTMEHARADCACYCPTQHDCGVTTGNVVRQMWRQTELSLKATTHDLKSQRNPIYMCLYIFSLLFTFSENLKLFAN